MYALRYIPRAQTTAQNITLPYTFERWLCVFGEISLSSNIAFILLILGWLLLKYSILTFFYLILIKLYKPLPASFEVEEQLQIITKVGETQVFEVEFNPNLEFIDNLLSLKGPNYNIDLKDRVNNSTNFKTFKDLVNTNSSQSYYQFNSLQNQKGVILRKNWALT